MTLPDPLATLPRPTADPAAARLAGERCWQLGKGVAEAGATLRHAVAAGTAQAVWVGQASTTVAGSGAQLAEAYRVTAEAAAAAARALLTCAEAWETAIADYGRARTLADDAVRQEAAHRSRSMVGVGPPTLTSLLPPPDGSWASPDRAQAQQTARTAIADVEAASRRCAAALDQATGVIEVRAPTPPSPKKKHTPWWKKGVPGFFVNGAEQAWSDGEALVDEAVQHPGELLKDTAEVGLGVGLTILGAAEETGGVALDATGVGAPVGAVLNVDGAVNMGAGAEVTVDAAADTAADASTLMSEARAGEGAAGSSDGSAAAGSSASSAGGSSGGDWLDPARAKVPDDWGPGTPARYGDGNRWSDPADPGNYIRVDKGRPAHPDPVQQEDHVHLRHGGRLVDRSGQARLDHKQLPDELTHIPLTEWLTWSAWYAP